MKNNKLRNFEMCTLAIVGALQFMDQLSRDLKVSAENKKAQQKPKPVMKVGKIYQLTGGDKAFCFDINEDGHYLCVMQITGWLLKFTEDGKCVYCTGQENLRDFDIRRTWKKKYDKQKDVE